jgi:cyclophilin family peptidyl-prolyl cis-trans isomerase/HEAT repeat protein
MTLFLRRVAIAAALGLVAAPQAGAQQGALVEQLAPVLAAEDARNFTAPALRAGLVSSDSFVRQTAAMAVGRIADARGVELLLPLLIDPDTTVRVAAVFALGLIGDTAAIPPLIERLTSPPALDAASSAEAMTSLARIGGRRAAEFLAGVVQGRVQLAVAERDPLVRVIALEAWRLGRLAPVAELLPLAADTSADMRWRAVYSLSRLRPRAAASRLAESLRDPAPLARAFAVRAFTRPFADSAGVTPDAAAALIIPLVDDADAGVRVNALRAIASFDARRFVNRIVPRLDDANPNVRVEAAATLGAVGGPDAAAALSRVAAGRGFFAVRRAALLGLARADTAAYRGAAAAWARSPAWFERMVVAEADGSLGARPAHLDDRDSRVMAAAFNAWADAQAGADSLLRAEAGRLVGHRDPAVRSVAIGVIGRAPGVADLPVLVAAYRAAERDSFPDAAIAALDAMQALARVSDSARRVVEREFLARVPAPSDYNLKSWAARRWPAAAERWGPAHPVATGRTLQDYREIVRRYLVAPDSLRRPRVVIETEQRGTIEVELLGPDAPLTVANFLSLVDRRFFDGNRWHRVVPNFVVQDGDPRGDGWGGPGYAIRDEINRVRFSSPVLGMAHSGRDTGSSQWFLNLSPQPHLDGTYTVFGRVEGSTAALVRITQGDVIRTIRRQRP